MTDPRHRDLADVLVGYSTALRTGEKVLIEVVDVPETFTNALIRRVREAGAHPLVILKSQSVLRELLLGVEEEALEVWRAAEEAWMKGVDAYIGVRGSANISELSDVPQRGQYGTTL